MGLDSVSLLGLGGGRVLMDMHRKDVLSGSTMVASMAVLAMYMLP
jgi:hypothetical protein